MSGWQMIVLTRWKAAAKEEYLARAGQTRFVLQLKILDFVYAPLILRTISLTWQSIIKTVNFGNDDKT